MKRSCHVAVLGAGIMGSTTALLLARRGLSSTLFDAAAEPMSRASRWNEGKIHLGFLYAADSSLETVRRLMPGGLAFKPLMEQLIGTSLDRCSTTEDEIYLIHRDSVVSAEPAARHFAQVAALLRHAAGTRDYLVDVSNPKVQELSRREIEGIANARQIADRIVEAIASAGLIESSLRSVVTGVRPVDGSKSGQWMVETGATSHGRSTMSSTRFGRENSRSTRP
jgi:glycine/D-amino acid oxidase-like deaminating enzyme